MRHITEHQTNEANRALIVTADDPTHGNASHEYTIEWQPTGESAIGGITLPFQNGPIAEFGVNGITNEVLLAIVADRLRGFQSGPYACVENAAALAFVENAFKALESRTRAREARGVEGTHKP